MKHIEAAWIELGSKGIQYSVIKREMSMLRIRKQYNKLMKKG